MYSERFQKAIKDTLDHEGGFVDDPDDPGGTTNWGISLRFLIATNDLEHGDIDNDGDIDATDISKMKKEDAIGIYYEHFWKKYNYDSFPESIAAKTFDMCVNMGPKQAHKIVQRAANEQRTNLAVDGVIGPKTLHALSEIDPKFLLADTRLNQCAFYEDLAERRPTLKKFLKGWLRRAVL